MKNVLALFLNIAATSAAFAGFASNEVYLASIGRGAGSGEAQFYSTVWVTNLSSSATVHFTFYFLKDGQSNLSGAPSFADTLAPGQTKLYENVTETKLSLPGQFGAARITADGEIFASERVYNLTNPVDDLGKSEGLFFAAVPKNFAIGLGETASVQGVNQGSPTENMRSNFDLVETTGNSCTVHVTLLDSNGTSQGATDVNMVPYGHVKQSAQSLLHSIATINDRVVATVTAGSGKVILAGEQLANTSQDSSGFEMSFKDSLLGGNTGGNCTLCVTSLNGLTGAVTIAHGANTTVNVNGQTITIDAVAGSGTGLTAVSHDNSLTGSGTAAIPLAIANGQVVRSLNGLHDSVTLAAGTNVSIIPSGQTLTVNSAGFSLPYSGTVSTAASASAFSVTNSGNDAIGIQGVSGSGPGIYGASTSEDGVFGTSTSGPGVYGQSGTGYGVFASSMSGTAVWGQTKSSSAASGVYGTSHGQSGETGWAGVWGDSHDSTAVQGTSFSDRGVLGITSNVNAVAAVEGLNRGGGTGVIGFSGGASGQPTTYRAAVKGDSTHNTGVYGASDDFFGVLGYSHSSTGVLGRTLNSIDSGVVGQNLMTATEGRLGGPSYGVYSKGDFAGTGAKYFVEPHPTDASKEIRYVCLEGPEAGTYFRGTARIVNGFATIEVPDHFRMVSSTSGLTVQLTPIGDFAALVCVRKSLDQIVIKGSADVEFDYVVNGIRKAFAEFKPVAENKDFVPRSPDDDLGAAALPAESVRRLKASGILRDDGSINLDTAHRLGWDQRPGWNDEAKNR